MKFKLSEAVDLLATVGAELVFLGVGIVHRQVCNVGSKGVLLRIERPHTRLRARLPLGLVQSRVDKSLHYSRDSYHFGVYSAICGSMSYKKRRYVEKSILHRPVAVLCNRVMRERFVAMSGRRIDYWFNRLEHVAVRLFLLIVLVRELFVLILRGK
jgi:hypothetical protein